MSLVSYLTDRRQRITITVLRPEYTFERPAKPEAPSTEAFKRVWHEAERQFNKPPLRFTGLEMAIASRLVKKYPLDRLRELMLHWYRTSYEKVREDKYHPLVYFEHCLPTLNTELPT